MTLRRFVPLALIFATAILNAQTVDSNSITVFVSRSIDVRSDTAYFTLAIGSGIESDLTTITSALTAAGIQNATFVSLADNSGYVTNLLGSQPSHSLLWRFNYSAPYSQLKDTLTKLGALSSLGDKLRGLPFTFSLNGSGASDTAVADARRKLTAGLIDDAKKEAALIADSAGMAVGQILGISESYSSSSGASPGNVYLSGDFSATGSLSSSGSSSPTVSVSQTLTVKFAASR